MRCGTILAALADAGVETAAVTAKDKLRLMLSRGPEGHQLLLRACRPRQRRETASVTSRRWWAARNPTSTPATSPSTSSTPALRLLERKAASLLYLSLSDFIQHAHAPGTPEANAFNRAVDDRIARLVAAGAVVGVVADHGMNDKSQPDGEPSVVFLQEELNARFGDGAVRVICPITDPFVRHHGALGSFVRVYARKATDLGRADGREPGAAGVEEVLDAPGGRAPLRAAARPGG